MSHTDERAEMAINSRQLGDLLQFCETKCSADCCGIDALDLSENRIRRWCEFNGRDAAAALLRELETLTEAVATSPTALTVSGTSFLAEDVPLDKISEMVGRLVSQE